MPRLVIPLAFKKDLDAKPPNQAGAVTKCVTQLGINPRYPGLRTHRVQGTKGVWEARSSRGDRVTFEYGDDSIVLRAHCNHDVLKRP